MAIGGNTRPVPAKSSASSSRRRGTAAAAAAHPRYSSANTGSTRDGTDPSHPAILDDRHESNVQQQQPPSQQLQHTQPQQQQHTQRHQQQRQQEQHFRHQQNRVGKRYRDKLTAGFESLQTTLGLDEEVGDELDAAEGAGGGGEGGGGEGAQGDVSPMMGSSVDVDGPTRRRRRPLNKARIIDLTCERVRELVEEWEATRAEVEAMRRERALQGW